MAAIVLATLNARYSHASFGLRYLKANLRHLEPEATILEFDIHQRPIDIVESITREAPRVVGFGVYIWNVLETLKVIRLLKRVLPEIKIVIGGPEVSYEYEQQAIVQEADFLIRGEADHTFRELCEQLLHGLPPADKVIASPIPTPESLASPYHLYTEKDLSTRTIYVEASRGCPFSCEFCLSSLDIPVRQFELAPFLAEMDRLYKRGARQFKFVDRTFNLNIATGRTILQFFLDRYTPGLFVHFEMVPDRLPEGLRALITQFPPGALQFEIGIQSFNPEVNKRISRRQDLTKLEENLTFLRTHTGVHLHTDLIVGLPGETIESFSRGFNRLVELNPHEIQVGILKRLKGTPIGRHDQEWGMIFSPDPPYEILANTAISFAEMQRLSRFSRYWDLVANSGSFSGSRALLWKTSGNPFQSFLAWSDWLYARTGMRHQFSAKALAELLFEYLTSGLGYTPDECGPIIVGDLVRLGRKDIPGSLQIYSPIVAAEGTPHQGDRKLPKRQNRHIQDLAVK